MTAPRSSDPAAPSRQGAAPAAPAKRNPVEERDWYASSRDLAEGLVVREVDEPMPPEFGALD
jgi:hypothetical protein